MKTRLLVISSIASLFLLSWYLDAKLQPRHCINSSIIRYAVDYKAAERAQYSKRDGHHKPLKSSMIPSCEFNEYFKLPDGKLKSAAFNLKGRIESLETFQQVLPTVYKKIDLIIRDDQARNIMISPTRVEMSHDLVNEPRLLEKSLLLSWIQQSYLTIPANFQNLLADFLYSTSEGQLSMGSVLVADRFIMITSAKEYCDSKLKSVSHYQVCKVLKDTNYKLDLAKNEKYFNFSKSFRVSLERLWMIYEKSSLTEKLSMLKRLKSDEFRLAFLRTMSNQNDFASTVKVNEVLNRAFSVPRQINRHRTNLAEIEIINLNKTKNNTVFNSISVDEFKEKHQVQGKQKLAVILKCGDLPLSEVAGYSDFTERLLHIKNCNGLEFVDWKELSKNNFDKFFKLNKKLKFNFYHLPSLKLAEKHSRLDLTMAKAFKWQNVVWDDKLEVHKPKAVYDAVTHYRN